MLSRFTLFAQIFILGLITSFTPLEAQELPPGGGSGGMDGALYVCPLCGDALTHCAINLDGGASGGSSGEMQGDMSGSGGTASPPAINAFGAGGAMLDRFFTCLKSFMNYGKRVFDDVVLDAVQRRLRSAPGLEDVLAKICATLKGGADEMSRLRDLVNHYRTLTTSLRTILEQIVREQRVIWQRIAPVREQIRQLQEQLERLPANADRAQVEALLNQIRALRESIKADFDDYWRLQAQKQVILRIAFSVFEEILGWAQKCLHPDALRSSMDEIRQLLKRLEDDFVSPPSP